MNDSGNGTTATDGGPELLAQLRDLEEHLYDRMVVTRVLAFSAEERNEFVKQRLDLSEVIAVLQARRLEELRLAMTGNSEELVLGVRELTRSLGKLDRAVAWAAALRQITKGACSAFSLA